MANDFDFQIAFVIFGHDSHQDDYGGFNLTFEAYPRMVQLIREAVGEKGLIFVLSGGSCVHVAERVIPDVIRVLARKVAVLRMASDCYPCILDRAKFECDLVFSGEEEKKAAVEELLDYMACHKGGVPALVGTEREFIIKRRSGSPDPYKSLKEESNRVASDLLPMASEFYEKADDKIEALIRIAAAANSMEFGVKGHDFDNTTFGRVFENTLREKLQADIPELKRRLQVFGNIFYLTDNCGEVIFDLFVIEKLKDMGKRVVIGSKSEPVLNDVTVEELGDMTD